MSPRNFVRRFKAATGRSPGSYLQAKRVTVAKEMLESGARSVQAVGETVGYEDVAFFRAVFKRDTGMTPAEYRERFGLRNTTSPERSSKMTPAEIEDRR
jgi:transcriptional regulator GlxA family with amidase domain